MLNYLTDIHSLSAAAASDLGKVSLGSLGTAGELEQTLISGGKVLLQAIIILAAGWWVVNLICKLMQRWLSKSKLDAGAASFISSMIKYALRILLFIVVISKLGVDMTSIVAVFTSAALAVGLALQGSLANIAGGLLILITKPFRVGDYIDDSAGHEGTVRSLDLIYTQLLTVDNKTVWIPNGTLANSSISNLSDQPIRKIDFNLHIEYDQDIDTVREVLLDVAAKSEFVEREPEPQVLVKEFESSSVLILLRIGCRPENYWSAKFEVQEAVKKAFDASGIKIPYDHLDVSIEGGN